MIEFRLPSLGSDMDDGTLVEWRVRPGDAVRRGQVVAVVDTTKAAIDVECWDEGIVHALLAEPGVRLPVGAPLALLRAAGESAEEAERAWAALQAQRAGSNGAAPASAAGAAATSAAAAAAVPAASLPTTATTATPAARRVTPAARKLAAEHGLDLALVPAPTGVVLLEDVQAAIARRAAAAAPAVAPIAPIAPIAPATPAVAAAMTPAERARAMRQTIAAAMSRSKREIPHYYLSEEIDFERAAAWLAERNATLPPAARLLPAALLVKAVAVALARYPEFNGFWKGDAAGQGAFVPGTGVHPGVAISLRGGGGLVAPALHDAGALDIATLTRALLDLVRRTRAGALRSSELADATITVTNLGEQGVGSVFGVIYPPQVALVGFGRIAPRACVADDGRLVARPMLTATLAADHRASDGHRGALLLAEIRELLQSPEQLDQPAGSTARDGSGDKGQQDRTGKEPPR